jgi:hypothetical protein
MSVEIASQCSKIDFKPSMEGITQASRGELLEVYMFVKNKWERRDSTPGSISQNFGKCFPNFSKIQFIFTEIIV